MADDTGDGRREGGKGILMLLLVGGILLPLVGWVIGVVRLWRSDLWTPIDKIVGTLIVPGGLLLPLWVLVYYGAGAGWGACYTTCVYQMSGDRAAALILGFTLASVGSIVFLALRRARARADSGGGASLG